MKVDELAVPLRPFLQGMRKQHLRCLSEIGMRTNFAEGDRFAVKEIGRTATISSWDERHYHVAHANT